MTNKFPAQPLFHTSTAQEFLVTPAKLPATLQTLRQDIQTGLVEIFLPALEKRYAILFAGGEPVNIYSLQRPVKRILPNSRLEKLLLGFDPDEKVLLRVLSLSPQTIRMVKIWIEQQADRASQPLATIEIEEHLSSLQKSGMALVYYSWPSAEALALLPGNGDPPLHTLFVSGDQMLHSAGGIMALLGWKEPDCYATVLNNLASSPAWDEYLLHHSFVLFLTRFLPRLENLAGRSLVSAILRDMNFTASAHSWNISITTNSVTDQAIFTSPEDAAEVYKRMIDSPIQRAESALGVQVTQMLEREIAASMSTPARKLFHRHIHLETRLLPVEESLPPALSSHFPARKDDPLRL